MDLKHIFEALVPENIKEIPLMRDAMTIFLTNLENNSSISFDIKKIYDNFHQGTETINATDAKTALRAGLLDVYLQSLYNTIKKAQHDRVLQKKLNLYDIKGAVTVNNAAEQILGTEFFVTNKTVKESVGTKSSINHAFNVASTLESNEKNARPIVTPVKPFYFLVEGVITSEMYSAVVKELAHPVGFAYQYTQIVKESMHDFFGLTKLYNTKAIEIRGSNGTFDIFTPLVNTDLDSAATDTVWADFQTRINILTNNLFLRAEFDNLVTVWDNKIVEDINEVITPTAREITVSFTDTTQIIQTPGNGVAADIIFIYYHTWIKTGGVEGIIRDYSPSVETGHNSLFTDYTFEQTFDYYDVIESTLLAFTPTLIKDSSGEVEALTYIDHNGISQPIDTSEYLIMTSPDYANDNLDILVYSNGGLYLMGNGAVGITDYYLTTQTSADGFATANFVQGTNTGVVDVAFATTPTPSLSNVNADYLLTAAVNGDITISSTLNGLEGTVLFSANATTTIILNDAAELNITFGNVPTGIGGETNNVTVTGQDKYSTGIGLNAAALSASTLTNAGTNTILTYTFTETSIAGTSGTVTITNGSSVGTVEIISGVASSQEIILSDNNSILFVYDGTPLVSSTAGDAGSLITKQGGGNYLTFTPSPILAAI